MTEGQTAFLRRSERPFSHYATALIYRNTKIQLNGAIFSFAFGGHFSCLKNSSNSDGKRGFIVLITGSVRVRRLGLHSPADSHRSVLEFSLNHTPSCVATNQQLRQSKEGNCPVMWSTKEIRIHIWLPSALCYISYLTNLVGNLAHK